MWSFLRLWDLGLGGAVTDFGWTGQTASALWQPWRFLLSSLCSLYPSENLSGEWAFLFHLPAAVTHLISLSGSGTHTAAALSLLSLWLCLSLLSQALSSILNPLGKEKW